MSLSLSVVPISKRATLLADMFKADFDIERRLLIVSYSGHVDVQQLESCYERVTQITSGTITGFRVLTDLSGLESMDGACALKIGDIMDWLAECGIERIVRVIPDPQKDIGFSLISQFHYDSRIPILTCESLQEALLSLQA